ncbi:MAG: fibronectin type III domain-containing protein [bacterium]
MKNFFRVSISIFILLGVFFINSQYSFATTTVLGSIGTSASGGEGIAIDSVGNIYVANYNDTNVMKITPSGVSSVFFTAASHLFSVAVDASDNVYVANFNTQNITKLSSSGVVLGNPFASAGILPINIKLDSAGNIYVVNRDGNNVTKITPAGVSSVFGTTGNQPYALVLDPAGNAYVANYNDGTVTKITPAGVSSVFGTTGNQPHDIAIDSVGNIYTANYNDNTVTKITPAGVSSVFGTTGTHPYSIVVDKNNNVYTTDNGGGTVTKITPAGVSSVFESTLTHPSGITIDTAGTIYVVNVGGGNVKKITQTFSSPNTISALIGTPADTQISLSWTAPVVSDLYTPVTDYSIQYKKHTDNSWMDFSHSASTATTATLLGLSSGTAYDIQIAAINSAGTGSYVSVQATTTTPIIHHGGGMSFAKPNLPKIVAPKVTTNGTIDLSLVGDDIVMMAFSDHADFANVPQQIFTPKAKLQVCDVTKLCTAGVHTIYARFYNKNGMYVETTIPVSYTGKVVKKEPVKKVIVKKVVKKIAKKSN